ncbi:very large low complexity [Cryptosporidium sp. chipmunk genotype I]|uniref:very large low complexity n=1 Tax=Cryptosporidium sp. chipmunk genotype I TaxID=1280935 RepID=UPI00351A503A|nr:very large low complexity [Cryptosporidium sp. chipmunk genotype I]
MDRNRWAGLLKNCNRCLLSFQVYASHQYLERGSTQEIESLVLKDIPIVIRERVENYAKKSVVPQNIFPKSQIFLEEDVIKTISCCFQVDTEEACRIFRGFNYLREGGFIIRFTNTDDQFLSKEITKRSGSDSESKCSNSGVNSGGVLDCFFSDVDLMSKIYDFILQEQLSLLDSVKFMYENANFEKEHSGFGAVLKKACFGEVLWGKEQDYLTKEMAGGHSSTFNILDELWRWYSRLVNDHFVDFDDPELERVFGGPLLQSYSRQLLESNLLHTILVVLQAHKGYIGSLSGVQRKLDTETNSNADNNKLSAGESLSKSSPLNRCRLIISELQSKCFLGSLYTLYSSKGGVGIGPLTFCDNSLAHSTSMIDQLRQTASNGVLLASSLVLLLSPKEITINNEDLGFLINVVVTLLDSLFSNDSGEVLCNIQEENYNFSTPARAKVATLNVNPQKQLSVRGNLLLVHAKVVKPLLPALIFSYASIVVQTPNRDSLLAPILSNPSFFQSRAFSDSLENILHALSSQHPLKQYISVSILSSCELENKAIQNKPLDIDDPYFSEDLNNDGNKKSIILGEAFGTYYQHLVLYSIIRNTVSTFSLNALPFVARISKHLSFLLRKEPRLVYRECWRGDYFRQIGVHLIIELFMSSFPYGIVEFFDLLNSLVPDFNSIPKFNQADIDIAKQSFKLFMTFLRTPIKNISFPPYLPSLGLSPIPVNNWSPDSIRNDSELPQLPLHLEVSHLETPDLALGASFSQASLTGTLEGCLLDFLEIKLNDVTPLSAGFPNARKCMTPLRVLPIGVAQPIPLKSLLIENSETSFSSPLWSNSPYGTSYDFPEVEMPPYYHIHNTKSTLEESKKAKNSDLLDINKLRLPSELNNNSTEIKLGDLDPFTIKFCCKNIQNPDSLPSLLKILLLIWESIGLSLSQLGGKLLKQQIEMLVSLSELIYRLASFHPSIIFVLDQEIFSWNALIPNVSQQGLKASSRFGLLTIKTIQMLKGICCLISNKTNGEETVSVTFQTLPRLINLLQVSLQPIDLLSIDDAVHGNFLKLQVGSREFNKGNEQVNKQSKLLSFLFPWSHQSHDIPMYWLVPLLVSCIGSKILVDPASQKDAGYYSPLLKGIQGFNLDELFNLVSKSLEIVEKQLKSYPITAQILDFIVTLLKFCPASFWGLGWDRHARLLLSTLGEFSYGSTTTNKIIRDIQFLINDCIICQQCSEELEQQRDLFGFFGRISHFSIHTVLSRISSWQFNLESEKNLLLLRSLSVFGLLLNSMDSATLIKSDEDYEQQLNENMIKPEVKDGNSYTLKDIIPSISGIASSNHRAIIATLLKHITETGLIPSLLTILSCEYSIHSQSFKRSRYSQIAKDELNDIPAPWELLISNSIVTQAMEKNESLSFTLALHLQHSNSQVIFLDKLLVPTFECSNTLPNRSGELFSSPDVIVAQQVVTEVLKVVQKLLNSVADLQTNSDLLCSLRKALVQWILSSSSNQGSQISNNLLNSPKFSWSDTDIISQHIHSRISILYLSKKPVMNLVKSLFSLMLSFVPSSMTSNTPIFAAKFLSSFCYILSSGPSVNNCEQSQLQNSRLDIILEQILKPSASLCSIQQDFLLSLTNTKLFPLLIKLLYQELDFVLLAPIFSFLKTFEFSESKLHNQDKTPIEFCKVVLELINLFSASHPSTLIGSTGSFSFERLDHVLNHCKSNLTIRSGNQANGSLPSSFSRIGLICHAIVGILEKSNSLLASINKTNLIISSNLLNILNLIPLSLNLLNQLFENTKSKDFLIREMFLKTKDIESSPSATSIWNIVISVTQNLTLLWNCLQLNPNISQAKLQLLTIISSSVACTYHLTSRFISVSTNLSFKNYDKLPIFLRERRIFDFVKYLVSDKAISEILHSSKSSKLIFGLFLRSNNHFLEIEDKLGVPIKYCVFSKNNCESAHDSELTRTHNFYSDNSLEQFVNKYYYERYLKFSHLIISNESINNLTEFNISKICEFRDQSAKDLRSSSFDPSNQAFKLPPSNNSETSQLATLEMVWESGQLLAPKQHFPPNSTSLERKDGSLQASDEDPLLKHSVVSSRIKERTETVSPLLISRNEASNSSLSRIAETPSLLSLRNSSFIHKTRQWGPEFELDVSAMLVLLSCSTAACISVPHSEMDIQSLLNFSKEIIFQIRRENSSRSFLESFMYLLTSYNELVFYLKTLLPVVIAKFSSLVTNSFLSELAVLFDSTKLGLINHCISLAQKESHDCELEMANESPKTPILDDLSLKKPRFLPNLMMTILFSTCTDLLTFDLVSNVRLILGRAEMIETQNSLKALKSSTGVKSGEKNDSYTLNLTTIAPNSSSVCLSSSWQDLNYQNLRNGQRINHEASEFGGCVGNLINYMPVSEFSEKNQRSNIRKLFSSLIEQCCRYIIRNLRNIFLSQEKAIPFQIQAQNRGEICLSNFDFKYIWTIQSYQTMKSSVEIQNSQENDICLSCDLTAAVYLLLFALKQLSSLIEVEDNTPIIESTTIALLLELTSCSMQFYKKNGKVIHRIANEVGNVDFNGTLLNFLSSSLIALPILCLSIPAKILEVIYIDNRKKLIQDISSEFTMNTSNLKYPIITRIKELLVSNPFMYELNIDMAVKIIPILDSVIQLSSTCLEKNEAPSYSYQQAILRKGRIESIGYFKPLKVPFLSWSEAAYHSLLASTMSCLVAVSSTPQGCVFILKSGILVQIASNFFLNGFRFTNISAPSKQLYESSDSALEIPSIITSSNSSFWPSTYLTVELGDQTIRNPMHILWCKLISLATNVFASLEKFSNRIYPEVDNSLQNKNLNAPIQGGTEFRHSMNTYTERILRVQSVRSLSTISRKFKNTKMGEETNTYISEQFVRDDSQAKEGVLKFIQLVEPRIQQILSEQRQISQLATLEEFNLGIDLIRATIALNIPELRYELTEILRKSLRTIRSISVVSLGRGITETFDSFKPTSRIERISAGQSPETLNLYHLDSLPAQVPSIFHQRCCTILLNSVRSIIDTFISETGFSLELRGCRELLMQLFHDTMDLGRPILQLLEDIPNHCYSVFTIVKSKGGEPFLPLSLNIQALNPSEPSIGDFLPEYKNSSLNKNNVEFKGIARVSAITESCCLPEMITFSSFVHLLSSLVDTIAICGAKCLYTLESLEASDQHNDTIRRFLEFLHLSQGLNSSSLLDSSRKLIEKVYANLKSKLGDQINVEVVGLVGIKKDPIHTLLFDRLSNTNSNVSSGI